MAIQQNTMDATGFCELLITQIDKMQSIFVAISSLDNKADPCAGGLALIGLDIADMLQNDLSRYLEGLHKEMKSHD